MAEGDVSNTVEPFLTSDEMLLLQEINPKYRSHDDRQSKALAARAHAEYKAHPEDEFVNGVIAPAKVAQMYGAGESDNPEGGFLPFLLPILGALAPSLIGAASQGIGALAKKMFGRGVFPPNVRGTLGRGTLGRGMKQYLNDHLTEMLSQEAKIRGLRGKRFWHHLLKMVKRHLKLALGSCGMSLGAADEISREMLHRLIPKSFIQYVAQSSDKEDKAEGSGKPESSHLRSIVRPIAEWSIHKVLGKGAVDPKIIRDLVDDALLKYDTKYTTGSGPKWDKFTRGISRFWDWVKPTLVKVATHVLPHVANIAADRVPSLMHKVLSRFTVTDGNKDYIQKAHELIDSAKTVIPAGSKKLVEYMSPTAKGGKLVTGVDKYNLSDRFTEGEYREDERKLAIAEAAAEREERIAAMALAMREDCKGGLCRDGSHPNTRLGRSMTVTSGGSKKSFHVRVL